MPSEEINRLQVALSAAESERNDAARANAAVEQAAKPKPPATWKPGDDESRLIGMTLAQVEAYLGAPARLRSADQVGKTYVVNCQYSTGFGPPRGFTGELGRGGPPPMVERFKTVQFFLDVEGGRVVAFQKQ